MTKTNPGNFFEDFSVGQVIEHATPRTVTEGDRALYGALYPTRFAVPSSAEFAASVGLTPAPVEELIGFHIAFGKTVPDISLNAVANLGYAECRFHQPVVPGDTLRTSSEVIGLKENSNGRSGVVYVRSTATNQRGEVAIDWARWVMVHKRDTDAKTPDPVIPELAEAVAAEDLVVPAGLDFTSYDFAAAGEPHRFDDYRVGERIDHVDGVTLTDPEHMLATRLWQNTAKVHFNTEARPDGNRLIYGGHVISMARALSFNGLANAPRRPSPGTPSTRGPRCWTRRRPAPPAWVRCGSGWWPPRVATSRWRCAARTASMPPGCCSTSTTGRSSRADLLRRAPLG